MGFRVCSAGRTSRFVETGWYVGLLRMLASSLTDVVVGAQRGRRLWMSVAHKPFSGSSLRKKSHSPLIKGIFLANLSAELK